MGFLSQHPPPLGLDPVLCFDFKTTTIEVHLCKNAVKIVFISIIIFLLVQDDQNAFNQMNHFQMSMLMKVHDNPMKLAPSFEYNISRVVFI